MSICVERGEQRPRCDGGKVECSASGAERRGSLLYKIAIKQEQWKACFLIAEHKQFIQNCEYPVGTRRAVSAVRAQAIYSKLRLNK